MKIKVIRRKLRNCIRKDTFRYYWENDVNNHTWDLITQNYGPLIQIPSFNLLQIENDKLIIRKAMNEDSCTLIKKKQFNDDDELNFHRVIGFIK